MSSSGVDCSYTDSNQTFHQNICADGTVFCCINEDVKVCSSSTCGISAEANNLATYAFWLILAGVAVFGAILLAITYALCRYRKPHDVLGHRKSIFGETLSQADQSRVTSRRGSKRPSASDFHINVEHIRSGAGNPVHVRAGNSNMINVNANHARWTILNNFNSRHQNKRTDSREKILRSTETMPDVQ